MAKLISKTYGEALYELAVEENKVDELLDEVKAVKAVFAGDEEFRRFMNHPQVTKEEKIQIIENSMKGRVSDELTGFLEIIVEKGRFKETDAIFDYFIEQIMELKNIGTAFVQTPAELNEIQKSNIKERLLETTKYKEMQIHYAVDPSLIGGMVIRIGDRVIDSSIRTKLYNLTKDLQKIQLQ